MVHRLSLGVDFRPPYEGVGLQEGQVLRANPLYGVGLQDSTAVLLSGTVEGHNR